MAAGRPSARAAVRIRQKLEQCERRGFRAASARFSRSLPDRGALRFRTRSAAVSLAETGRNMKRCSPSSLRLWGRSALSVSSSCQRETVPRGLESSGNNAENDDAVAAGGVEEEGRGGAALGAAAAAAAVAVATFDRS